LAQRPGWVFFFPLRPPQSGCKNLYFYLLGCSSRFFITHIASDLFFFFFPETPPRFSSAPSLPPCQCSFPSSRTKVSFSLVKSPPTVSCCPLACFLFPSPSPYTGVIRALDTTPCSLDLGYLPSHKQLALFSPCCVHNFESFHRPQPSRYAGVSSMPYRPCCSVYLCSPLIKSRMSVTFAVIFFSSLMHFFPPPSFRVPHFPKRDFRA